MSTRHVATTGRRPLTNPITGSRRVITERRHENEVSNSGPFKPRVLRYSIPVHRR